MTKLLRIEYPPLVMWQWDLAKPMPEPVRQDAIFNMGQMLRHISELAPTDEPAKTDDSLIMGPWS